jgi:uncharacterized repeat protein (TIGR03803 family)
MHKPAQTCPIVHNYPKASAPQLRVSVSPRLRVPSAHHRPRINRVHYEEIAATSGEETIMHRIAILALTFAASAPAGTLQLLHAFGIHSDQDGNDLYAGVILDSSGNVYGVAATGGAHGDGVVYELSRANAWTETALYDFKGHGTHDATQDGANPNATLMADSAGNLYGATVNGGLTSRKCKTGCGTVFMLTPAAGRWQETVLYRFTGGSDGAFPYTGVTLDSAGNLYGTTNSGGAANAGTVYRLTPGPNGWQETVLYAFQGHSDGATPFATPILDPGGNIYGTTNRGGPLGLGIVYMLAPQPDGSFTEHVLHDFKGGGDGANPLAGLIFDRLGNLYGTTSYGGTANCGTVFKLIPDPSGGWKEGILYSFLGPTVYDGQNPNELTFDAHGNLYGTTSGGGNVNAGTIFEMTRNPAGGWQETVLYSFPGDNQGAFPFAGVVLDSLGRL